MRALSIATAAVPVAGMIIAQGIGVLVLPEGTIDAATLAACNMLLSAAAAE